MSWQGLLNTVSKGYAKHKSYFARGLDSSPVADEAALAAAEAEEAAANAAAEAEAAALCTEPIIKVITWRIPRNRQFA